MKSYKIVLIRKMASGSWVEKSTSGTRLLREAFLGLRG
jgi:hypothetical protein